MRQFAIGHRDELIAPGTCPFAWHDGRMESVGSVVGEDQPDLAVLFTVLTIWAWGSHIGPTSTGELCGARVFSFRPGHRLSASSGEMSAATRHSVDAPCQAAAKPYWDRGCPVCMGARCRSCLRRSEATSRRQAASVPRPPANR